MASDIETPKAVRELSEDETQYDTCDLNMRMLKKEEDTLTESEPELECRSSMKRLFDPPLKSLKLECPLKGVRHGLEVYSGKGNLSNSFRKRKISMYEVDIINGEEGNMKKRSVVENLQKELVDDVYDFAHVAIPCETYSNARYPKLRSKAFPAGKPNLPKRDRMILREAKVLLKHSLMLVETCCAKDIPVSIENPATSLLWKQKDYIKLTEKYHFETVILDYCQYGAPYRKRTRLDTCYQAHEGSFLSGLERLCPGVSSTHHHPFNLSGWKPLKTTYPLKMLPTSKGSASYPVKLCEEWADIVQWLLG